MSRELKVGIIGLGYVGLPVALGFAKHFSGTIAFDLKKDRIESLKSGTDSNGDLEDSEFNGLDIKFTSNEADLKGCNFFVVAVPTPIDCDKRPDLRALVSASETVGRVIQANSIIVYESTVYPGVTEDICGPAIEKVSGLKRSKDFFLGYSPERINPGDREHTLERIIKVVSGENEETLDVVAKAYGRIVKAGVFKAKSIKVAEAAKVIENTQRDLNIALMNELSIIFDKMNISTNDVLEAAGTKWNFLKFSPGLVGGHCIGVDPYYLTTKAEQLGYHPQVILAGRRINDEMGFHIAKRAIKLMTNTGIKVAGSRIGVLGITFKENVADMRNSRVPDIIKELREFGAEVLIHDPLVKSHELEEEYHLSTVDFSQLVDLDAIILAVSHNEYKKLNTETLEKILKPKAVVIDVKSILDKASIGSKFSYWSL